MSEAVATRRLEPTPSDDRLPAEAPAASRSQPRGDTARTFGLVLRFTERAQRTFVLALAMLIIEAATAVFQAYPLAYLIDFLKGDRPGLHFSWLGSERTSTVAVLTLAIVVLAAVNSLADSAAEIYLARGGRTLGYRLRVALFAHLQRLSLAFHDRRRTGDVITRVTGDVKELEEFVILSMSDVAGSALLLVGVLTFLAFKSWQVTLVGLAIIPILATVSNYFAKRIKVAAKTQRAREGDLATGTQEMLTSIRVVQTFGRASHDEQRFAEQSGKTMDAALEAARLQAWFSWVVSVIEATSIAVVIWIGLWLIDRRAITVGTLVLFALLIGQMFKPTRRIIREWNTLAKVYASVERIGDLLNRPVTVRDEPGAVPAPPLSGRVEFRHVSFAYRPEPEEGGEVADAEPREALKDVSFTIEPGEMVALIGPSGAGKTTIAQLLPRLYDPQAGAVLLDGHDVRMFTLESFRSQISLVHQETVLVSGTVAENIAYGKTAATREEIVSASIRANAHEFIEQMPDGYDTELSERASNLSGGQRQRIAIARAFIRNTPILILDEPTTGLDSESKKAVLRALRMLMKGKATLVISHDRELIRAANRRLTLRAGKIVQDVTRRGLLEHEGPNGSELVKVESLPTRPSEDSPSPDGREALAGAASPSPSAVRARRRKPPKRALGLRPEDGIDLRQSVELRRELPHLEVALDAGAIRDRLQETLVGTSRGSWSIEQCTPGKAMYLPGEGCSVRYDLLLRQSSTRLTTRALVGGRLLRGLEATDFFFAERVAPLAERVREREEMAPLAKPAAVLSPLSAVAFAYPIDPELPRLAEATDCQYMLDVFRDTVPEALGESLELDACRVEVAHYARRGRCVLRYELDGRLSPGNEPSRRILYGKVGGNSWAGVDAVQAALRKQALEAASAHRFRIPHLLAVRHELELALVQSVPGELWIPPLVKACVGRTSGRAARGALEEAVVVCGRIAAVLHQLDAEITPSRTLGEELAALWPGVALARRFSPGLAAKLEELLALIDARARASDVLPLVPSHGDYTPSQVVFDGEVAGILDLDGVCLAEPALDLAQFCAYLRMACCKPARTARSIRLADHLCERFLTAYMGAEATRPAGFAHIEERVAVYELVSLVRIAVRSWQQLKAARTERVLELLEERLRRPWRFTQ